MDFENFKRIYLKILRLYVILVASWAYHEYIVFPMTLQEGDGFVHRLVISILSLFVFYNLVTTIKRDHPNFVVARFMGW